jgi:hypothetical protein
MYLATTRCCHFSFAPFSHVLLTQQSAIVFFAIRYPILATSHGHAFFLTYDVSRLNERNNKRVSVLFSNCLSKPINCAASGQHGSPDHEKTTWAASRVFSQKSKRQPRHFHPMPHLFSSGSALPFNGSYSSTLDPHERIDCNKGAAVPYSNFGQARWGQTAEGGAIRQRDGALGWRSHSFTLCELPRRGECLASSQRAPESAAGMCT